MDSLDRVITAVVAGMKNGSQLTIVSERTKKHL